MTTLGSEITPLGFGQYVSNFKYPLLIALLTIGMLRNSHISAYKLHLPSVLIISLFIYLFLSVFGLRCCTRAFSSCGERGLLFVAVRGVLTAVASPVAEHRL